MKPSIRVPIRAGLAVGMGLAATVQVGARAAENGADIASSGLTTAVDCAGGPARVAGSGNTLSITGDCSRLEVLGSNDRITISLGRGATVQVVGSNNDIAWTMRDGAAPKFQSVGSGNTIRQGS